MVLMLEEAGKAVTCQSKFRASEALSQRIPLPVSYTHLTLPTTTRV